MFCGCGFPGRRGFWWAGFRKRSYILHNFDRAAVFKHMEQKYEDPHIDLMLAFKNGNAGAFRDLFEAYKVQILNFIYRFCQDRRIAEELTQEVFLRVYRAAPTYRPDARFSTWIYRIATNMCLNEMRSGKYMYERPYYGQGSSHPGPQAEQDFPDTAPARADNIMVEEETQASVRRAISLLPEKQRAALLMNVYDVCSYREIGRRLGCSEGAVKSIIHRAKQAVKVMLQKELKKKC
jgi:RNA polymerase sigma-70 factor, ECF subfamily